MHLDTDGPTRVGSRATEMRRMPGGTRGISYEVTMHEAPRTSSFRGVNGPVRPRGTLTVEPLDGGTRSRLTLHFALEGRGLGVLLVPIARANARKEVPRSHRHLKEILEG